MHLYLSGRSPLNGVYTDENGQAIYKVHTPLKLSDRTSTITRSIPDDIPRREGLDDVTFQDRFAHLAQIDWRTIDSTKIRFAGESLDTGNLFRKDGWGWYGRWVAQHIW